MRTETSFAISLLMWPSGYCHDTDTSIDLQTRLTVIMNLKAKLVAKRVVLNIKIYIDSFVQCIKYLVSKVNITGFQFK